MSASIIDATGALKKVKGSPFKAGLGAQAVATCAVQSGTLHSTAIVGFCRALLGTNVRLCCEEHGPANGTRMEEGGRFACVR